MAAITDMTVSLFVEDPLVGSSVPPSLVGEPPSLVGDGSVGVMSLVGIAGTGTVGMVVSGASTVGIGERDGAGEPVGAPVGAGESDGAGEAVGAEVSARVGEPEGARLAVGAMVMEQSAFSIVEEISGMVKVSAVHSP